MGEHKLGYPLPLYYTIPFLGHFYWGTVRTTSKRKEKNVSENLTRYSTKNNGIFLFLIVLYFFLEEGEHIFKVKNDIVALV